MSDPTPDDETLRALVDGTLPAREQAELEQRLSTDPALRDRLDHLTAADEFTASYIPADPATHPPTEELTRLLETLRTTSPDSLPPPRTDLDPASFLSPPRTPDALGTLGDYDIVGTLGEGGMGIVFRAHDPALQRTVAIKVLAPGLAASPEARQEFLREARSAASLDHEHILPIHAVDQQGELPYFVMPLVEGPTLHERLKDARPFGLPEIVRYARAITAALDAAHANGIVHRDIKPANILTETAGERIWITDFGIAHPAGTSSGSLAGTPHYISPEQAAGQPTTPASDLFSLGVVLYEMATGSRPFEGENTAEILANVATHDPPAPSSLNPSIPTKLDSLILSLLSKTPSDRPASASAVDGTLDDLAHPPTSRHRLVLLSATAAVIAATAFLLRPDKSTPQTPRNRPLYSLFGDDRSFPSLADAIAATTPDASAVLINSDATIELAPLTTPSHPVLIRAAAGAKPVLRFTEIDDPAFLAGGPLELRHLTIVQRSSRRGAARIPPVVLSSGQPITVTHCRISRLAPAVGRVPGGNFGLEVIPPVFRLEGQAELSVTRSELYAIRGIGASTSVPNGTTKISFDHSIVATRRLIDTTGDPGARLEVTLTNNLVMASTVFDFLPDSTHPTVSVSAQLNLFELRGGIAWARDRAPGSLAESFSWTGSSNAYQIPHVAVHYGPAFDITNSDLPSRRVFEDWVALPFVEETNSSSHNIKASEHLNIRSTPLDSIRASDFKLNPKAEMISPDLGPGSPHIGPGAAPRRHSP